MHVEALESRRLLAGQVTGAVLLDAVTGAALGQIQMNSIVNLARSGTRLNLQAQVAGDDVAAVRFSVDGVPRYRVDASDPFTITDSRWALSPGTHTLVITPYADTQALGTPGRSFIASFTVIDTRPLPSALRVNVGGAAYEDSSGSNFRADFGFNRSLVGVYRGAIDGTADPLLYRTFRYRKSFGFTAAVPDDTYTLRLHFIEPQLAPSRLFDVFAEDRLTFDDLNIAAEAGVRTSLVKTARVTITDGRLTLKFAASRGDALICAIELIPNRAPAEPDVLRINAGGSSLVDSIQRSFLPDIGFTGGRDEQASFDVGRTTDDALFLDYRTGDFDFSYPVASGNYALFLDFVEPSALAGSRIFDVNVEGAAAITNLDVAASAGVGNAFSKSLRVNVTDGNLDLSFSGTVGEPILSAIALIPTDAPAGAPPFAQTINATWSFLRQIGMAIITAANANRGVIPLELAALNEWGVDHRIFANPRAGFDYPRGEMIDVEEIAWIRSRDDFIFLHSGEQLGRLAPETILVYENPQQVAGDISVLRADGSVTTVPREAVTSLPDPVLPPVVSGPVYDPTIIQSMSNLRYIATGLQNWAMDHRGIFPLTFGDLAYGYPDGAELTYFVNPRGNTPAPPADLSLEDRSAWINASTDYIYAGARKRMSASPEELLVYENPAVMPLGISILFADGHAEFREMRWAIETLARYGALP